MTLANFALLSAAGSKVPAWAPDDLGAALWAWWDVSDSGTVTLNGSDVSQITDKSGNGRTITQATAAQQPALVSAGRNGRDVMRFGGAANEKLETASILLTQTVNFFVVAKYDDADAAQRQLIGGATAGTTPLFILSGKWASFAGAVLDSGDTDDANWHIFTSTLAGASSKIRLDETEIASGDAGANGFTSLIIGSRPAAGQNWDGDIGEIFIVTGSMSSHDITAAETYLANRWGF